MTASKGNVPRTTALRPFVKWAGGKGQLIKKLKRFYPEYFGAYFEPFLGGAALFFNLVEVHDRFEAILSDTNRELATTYKVIKEDPEGLILALLECKRKYEENPEKYFYEIRSSEPTLNVEIAARLIFLNKTCFNGLYRVNSKGKFNVPFGRYKNPKICDSENLLAVSNALRWSKAKILQADYQNATTDAKKGDFIYFDPPYHPISNTANFTSYTKNGFSLDQQQDLARLFKELQGRGCYVLLSNSNTPEILSLYYDENIHVKVVPALRAINCKGNLRKGYTELIISNYKSRLFH
jgi:DNA adenine methylase